MFLLLTSLKSSSSNLSSKYKSLAFAIFCSIFETFSDIDFLSSSKPLVTIEKFFTKIVLRSFSKVGTNSNFVSSSSKRLLTISEL
ncbi:hypothetical protein AR438_10675 [Chryseobacterium aquaticum]|uniref:Uncharacterized protein n=1 Tax=Chryseobacterium aquaticum TaxID=452084 RepID=A0A0Q3KPG8_9FLAO|nr:hypothetical protein AR438_10675 [Chryseobacterium aquaticum]